MAGGGRADHEDQVALPRQLLDRRLPILGRVADIVLARCANVREPTADGVEDLARVVDGERGLCDHGHPLEIADRNPRGLWLEQGGLDSQARALRRARDILTRESHAGFTPEVDARLRSEFAGLLATELQPPSGWTRPEGTQLSERRPRPREPVATLSFP